MNITGQEKRKGRKSMPRFTLIWSDHSREISAPNVQRAASVAAGQCRLGEVFSVQLARGGKVHYFRATVVMDAQPIKASEAGALKP